jgi:hypothetical protein
MRRIDAKYGNDDDDNNPNPVTDFVRLVRMRSLGSPTPTRGVNETNPYAGAVR